MSKKSVTIDNKPKLTKELLAQLPANWRLTRPEDWVYYTALKDSPLKFLGRPLPMYNQLTEFMSEFMKVGYFANTARNGNILLPVGGVSIYFAALVGGIPGSSMGNNFKVAGSFHPAQLLKTLLSDMGFVAGYSPMNVIYTVPNGSSAGNYPVPSEVEARYKVYLDSVAKATKPSKVVKKKQTVKAPKMSVVSEQELTTALNGSSEA